MRRTKGSELFALVAVAQLMTSTQFAMISIALPDLVSDLGTSLAWASWAISLFTMMQAVAMPLLGRLSDTLGRRRIFVGGVATIGASSLACAVAPNIGVLIAARAVQGIAAGSLLPSAYGIVGDAFDGPRRTRMLGLISSVFPIGAIVGPNIGGLVVDLYGWRATFLVNVPLAVVVVIWGARRLPDAGGGQRRAHVDYLGALLLTLSVGTLMVALTELGRSDGGSRAAIVAAGLVVAVALGVALLVHETRAPHPLLDLGLLVRREFAFLNALNFFYGLCIFGMVAFVPLYAQEGYGLSAAGAGVLLTPRAVTMIAMSVLASMVLVRTGFRRPIGVGLVALMVSAALLSRGHSIATRSGLSDVVYLSLVVAVLGIGLGFAGPSVNQAGLDLLPDQVAGITGLRGMFRALGGAVGTAGIAAVASRAANPAAGLEHAFGGLAVLALLSLALLPGIPDRPGARARRVANRAPTPPAAAPSVQVAGSAARR